MKLFCYGDSNTYGYDPRGWGGRYSANNRFVDILKNEYGMDVVNGGMNGREVPSNEWGYKALFRDIADNRPDTMTIMLGTNDILCGAAVARVTDRMRKLIDTLQNDHPEIRLILIAPVPVKIYEPLCDEGSIKLCEAYKSLAEEKEIDFIDASKWDVPLAYDGVHFTEEGQRVFAKHLAEELN